MCTPYTKEEIKFLVEKFGNAARLAKNAGVDAIEIHAYGGYLIDQFLTPLWNKRTDEYGGSLENRLRIVYELRDAVWKNCGKDFPLIIKLTIRAWQKISKEKVKRVLVIGDNVRPAKVIDAVHEGFHTARLLEELTT